MRKLMLVAAMVLLFGVGNAFGLTAKVIFDLSTEPTDRTVVLVTETSGDYSASYGQTSEQNVDFVLIGNIKNKTEYFFIAYRLGISGEQSANSAEFAFTPNEPIEPVLYDLPVLEIPQGVISISIEIVPAIIP